MDDSPRAKRRKLSPTESVNSSPELSSINMEQNSVNISIDGSPILHLPPELLSAIIDYIPKTQWPSLELVNRSFRDAVYSNWQSVKEFDIDKDVLGIRQSIKEAAHIHLVDFLPQILAKLQLRSPILQSIIGFPPIYSNSMEATTRYQSEILQIVCQFTNLKRIDLGACGLNKSVELVGFLTSSASRDRLLEINSSAGYQKMDQNWPAIFTSRENSETQASRLKLKKLSLKTKLQGQSLDPTIIDLIDPTSLTVLVLDNIPAPSNYLLSLITNCNQVQQLQFSFIDKCRCTKTPCIHLTSSKRILEAIAALESLDSLKIGLIGIGGNYLYYSNQHRLNIEDDLPILIDRLGWRGRLVELGLLHKSYCSDQVIEGIADHLAGLKSLEIKQNSYPWTFVSKMEKMVALEKLVFNYSGRGISAVFQAMARHLQNLRIFHLCCSTNIDCLHLLTNLERLEELTITNGFCNNVEWESAFGHQLKSLEMRDCREELVTTLLKQAPGLSRLVISGYIDSDNVLCMIPTTCPRLREFYISSWRYPKECVQAIIDGCPELGQLRC